MLRCADHTIQDLEKSTSDFYEAGSIDRGFHQQYSLPLGLSVDTSSERVVQRGQHLSQILNSEQTTMLELQKMTQEEELG